MLSDYLADRETQLAHFRQSILTVRPLLVAIVCLLRGIGCFGQTIWTDGMGDWNAASNWINQRYRAWLESYTTTLHPGVTQYLHVIAYDTSPPANPDDLGPNGTAPWGVLDASLAARFIWAPSLDPNQAHYISAPILAVGLDGDYNNNGTVDAPDYVVWRRGLDTTYAQADYDVWRANFGHPAGSGSGANANAAVPEAASVPMLLAGLLVMCSRRPAAAS